MPLKAACLTLGQLPQVLCRPSIRRDITHEPERKHTIPDNAMLQQGRFLLSNLQKPCTRREAKTAKETLWAMQLVTQADTCHLMSLTGVP